MFNTASLNILIVEDEKKIADSLKQGLKNSLVVGDGENDICCIRKAGIGISFCSTSDLVDTVADYIIKAPDFNLLIPILA